MVVDNFLGIPANSRVLESIKQLDNLSAGELIVTNGNIAVDLKYKRNSNLWLDLFESNIVHKFQNRMFTVSVTEPELDHSNKSYTVLLSQYLAGDYYDWHTDVGGHVTWSYVCLPTEKIQGGQLQLSTALHDQDPQEITAIDAVNDRLVIFPAQYQHRVTTIESGCRYSIQLFFR